MPPKPRSGHSRTPTTSGRDSRQLLWVVGGVALLAVGIVVWLLVGSSNSSAAADDAIAAMKAAGCTVQVVDAIPGDHTITTPDGTSKKWNTFPPTSGPHYATPAIYGKYTEPLNQAQVVHNLEHGAIAIQYGPDVPASTVAELESFYEDHSTGTLLAPLPGLGDKIALGVWTTESASTPEKGTVYLAKCTEVDNDAYAAFFDAFQFRGPERFPADSMLPGNT